jgi:D-alanyl-D-alanine carboxypeptidase
MDNNISRKSDGIRQYLYQTSEKPVRIRAVLGAIFAILYLILAGAALAAPYAAMVIDARTGEVLHSRNADTRLHPASLTKMMTLYLAFQAVESGQISLDTTVTISRNAASEPPSKLGLRRGQKIRFRYLIRAAAVKSANDAATAIGEALAGSESAFAKRMTATAQQMGMTRTTFKNANGLTQSGHLSTARDMTTLGRRLFYDFPEYYNLFSRRTTDAGVKNVYNTNRRFLAAYKGADGIKTGYTNAAGFNLVASAERGSERIIATVFGERSTAARNARVAKLLDMGFDRAPSRVAVKKPPPLALASLSAGSDASGISEPRAVARSLVPKPRPEDLGVPVMMAGVDQQAIDSAVFAAVQDNGNQTVIVAPEQVAASAVEPEATTELTAEPTQVARAIQEQFVPVALPATEKTEAAILASLQSGSVAEAEPIEAESSEPRVIVRDTDDPRKWSVQVGAYRTRYQAEKQLLRTALSDLRALDGALRQIDSDVVQGEKFYRARFVGLSQTDATKACVRLIARNEACVPIGPGT